MIFFNSVILCFDLPDTALRDHRIELVRASWQELTIRISDISLSDEGQYTCSLFTMPVKTTKAFLTVLGEQMHYGPSSMSIIFHVLIVWMPEYFEFSLLFFFTTHLLLCRKITFLLRITVLLNVGRTTTKTQLFSYLYKKVEGHAEIEFLRM